MSKYIITAAIVLCLFKVSAQYKNDNVVYKTVYPQNLKKELKANQGYLLLDVRSKGEYADTSSMASANLGHLHNAININVHELGMRINELKDYKNKPVFVYCSHSQRSRRASKMLADSGFTKVFNINGGLTTLIQTNGAVNGLYETNNKYTIISPQDFCTRVNDKNNYIIDIRSDSAFQGISKNVVTNSMGRIKKSHNIPYDELDSAIETLPHNKRIIIVDDFGDEGAEAAAMLSKKGFTDVALLLDGLFNFENTNTTDITCKNLVWEHPSKYQLISAEEFQQMVNQHLEMPIVDVRTVEEFTNTSNEVWRNQGRVKNSINIAATQMTTRWDELYTYKDKPVVIYSSGSDNAGYEAAEVLTSHDFTKVYLLSGGIWNIRWRANNIQGKMGLKELITDVPPENQ